MKVCVLLLAFAAIAAAQPPYECTDDDVNRIEFDDITDTTYPDGFERRLLTDARCSFHPDEDTEGERHYQEYYEWEGYDGWYNNPAHPDWGGADMPMERKAPPAYPDGVYEIAGEERGNVLLITNMTQNGITGFGSTARTGLFIFFGQQVVEEMLDAQRPGCVPEYEDMHVPLCHALYDPDCRGDRYIPFLRNRYDFRTGYSPNNPRMQLNEITPWLDGGLMYGVTKTWADTLRNLRNGRLASLDETDDFPMIAGSLPIENTVGLPMANPPPPANNSLFPVNRFWRIGNPRGNENPFLLTMGILWFRVHNWWVEQLRRYGEARRSVPVYSNEEFWEEDEWLFNRARQLTIATHQHIVFTEWLPDFIPRAFVSNGGQLFPYESTPGYSAYFNRSGYNPAINPQIAHIFQSSAMRFGHTIVTPGIWRRQRDDNPNMCRFGSPISSEEGGENNALNNFLRGLIGQDGLTEADVTVDSFDDIIETFYRGFPPEMFPDDQLDTLVSTGTAVIIRLVRASIHPDAILPTGTPGVNFTYSSSDNPAFQYFSPRTCNAYWNPQVPIRGTDVDAMYLGMASQAGEREDTIITPDLRGKVFGPLDFTRRDLMAINLQRAREEGLPDFNSARLAYGLPRLNGFEELNPLYGVHPEVTLSIENLREVYNNDIDLCDIWVCGVAETIPSDYANYIGNQDATFDDLPSGPGELFTAVLFDQFMRIRHGDRFWYENYRANGILTQREFDFINSLTIKRLLVLITNITDADISDTPFRMDANTVCPQPYQLSELYMDDCSSVNNFDYYTESTFQIPIIWGLVFLYIALVVMLLFVMAAYNQHRRQKILASGRTQRAKKIEGTDITGGDGEVLVAWELKAGLKNETRTVSIKLGPGKRMVLYYGDTVLREVDLRFQTQLTILRPFDNHTHFVLNIPHEYDIILNCSSPLDRTIFIDKIQDFLNDIGIGHTIEEPQKHVMMANVYTKKDRQRLLETFFKSVFREGAQQGVSDVAETRRDILECELTRDEFADAMSLKKDSLFVEQMFTLIDQDGNGFISFREFLDMIVIFAKGSPEDKIKLMFEMYDVDHSGRLDREEFKKMLKAMMELVNASVSPDQMDQLIDSMFTAAGFQNKQELTLEDFNVLLRDHKEELSTAHLNISGFDVPEVEIKKSAEEEGEAVPSRYRARETAPARARRTIIKAYGRTTKGDPRAKQAQTDTVQPGPITDIPVQKRTLTQTKLGRMLSIFIRWVENYKLHIFYISLFELVVVGIFVERAYFYSVEREFSGLRRIAGFGVSITRGAASGMMFTYSVLLLTMARNLFTFLRETIFNYYIPLDAYLNAHKIVALTALVMTVAHCIGHGFNFYHISTQTANDLTCLFREVYHRTHTLPKFTYWLFLTMTGFSAFILTLVTVVMFVFATQYARRYTFQAFWFTHHWYVVFYILTFLHGSGRLVQDPLFGNFFLGPGIVFAIDQLISVSRRKVEVAVVRADILPSQVIGIYFKRPTTFDYRAGQWVRIASLAQNPGEYHPFTLSSAPNEEHLSLHIRAVGPWTHNFRENYNPANLRGQPYPKLYLDGPFGEGHQDWFRFEVSILVGGGIGVTPFASILKELVHRFNIGARVQCKKVFFIWVARSQKQYEWFTDIIREVEEADKKGMVEIHIFITQFFDKFDLRTTMLYICERHFQKLSGRSLFTGLRSVTHFGRPDFNSFFDNLQEDYIYLPQIGVFSCGPPGMTNGVEDACAATNRFEGPAFVHHFENF